MLEPFRHLNIIKTERKRCYFQYVIYEFTEHVFRNNLTLYYNLLLNILKKHVSNLWYQSSIYDINTGLVLIYTTSSHFIKNRNSQICNSIEWPCINYFSVYIYIQRILKVQEFMIRLWLFKIKCIVLSC